MRAIVEKPRARRCWDVTVEDEIVDPHETNACRGVDAMEARLVEHARNTVVAHPGFVGLWRL